MIGVEQVAFFLAMSRNVASFGDVTRASASAVALVPLGKSCADGLPSGDSVDGTYSAQSTISDVAPVTLRIVGAGAQGRYVPLGWVYTTPRGHYFQMRGSLTVDGSNHLVWLGGASPFLPIASFDGDFAKALRITLEFLGLDGKQLPPLLTSLSNGTAKYTYHSCYHP
jgi:hypothetical protein